MLLRASVEILVNVDGGLGSGRADARGSELDRPCRLFQPVSKTCLAGVEMRGCLLCEEQLLSIIS